MRLIKASTVDLKRCTLDLVEVTPNKVPRYAILSHTWGAKEISFSDLQTGAARRNEFRAAWVKMNLSCNQALEDGLSYIWVDTCCIDKTSSAEVSEAINSMFGWYRHAKVCYAYLSDVPANDQSKFASSRWFTRGWTFQELLAPRRLRFFSKEWTELGDRAGLLDVLAEITTIPQSILKEPYSELPVPLSFDSRMNHVSIAQIMSWASHRKTTRPEDMAYCLMGVFSVNMPLLYGEGRVKAFIRLQEEILKQSDDTSIFAWVNPNHWGRDSEVPEQGFYAAHGLLATSIECFAGSRDVVPIFAAPSLLHGEPYSMTNKGLQMIFPLQQIELKKYRVYIATLGCMRPYKRSCRALGIYLAEYSSGGGQFTRIKADCLPLSYNTESSKGAGSLAKKRRMVYIRQIPVGDGKITVDHHNRVEGFTPTY